MISLLCAMLMVITQTQDSQLLVVIQALGIPESEAALMAENPCAASGISCDVRGQIVSLVLTNRGLQGQIPRELGQLRHLKWLFLQNNQLSGEIPHELGQLEDLDRLYLHKNNLSGEIPHELGDLQNLERLFLYKNRLSGEIPSELGRLQSLEELDIKENRLRGKIPPNLAHLQHLQALDLQKNQLSGEIPVELSRLTNLKRLYLRHNHLSGEIPSELGRLQSLEELDLGVNHITGEIPPQLGQLKNLVRLLLHANQLSGDIPPELGQLRNLNALYLQENQLSAIPRELGRLRDLKGLYLYRNRLTGEIPGELGQLSKLKELFLNQNKLRGRIPELQTPSLKILNLQRNQLSGRIPSHLGQLKDLEKLDLHQNQLRGEIPGELSQLKKLEALYLHQNQLIGPIPQKLGRLLQLQRLCLHQNHLRGEIPTELGQLSNLRMLFLQENQLIGEIPRDFSQLKNLTILQLGHNRLTGPLPDELCKLEELQELYIQHNRLTHFPAVLNMPSLRILDGSYNRFGGQFVVDIFAKKVRHLDLSHNKFVGGISRIGDSFCSLNPTGGALQELRLNHNAFTGEIPSCLMRFERLTLLTLNDNRFHGSIPEVKASELVVLSLHNNFLTGLLPESFANLSHLGILTLHDNAIGGKISSLNLTAPCLDNSKFKLEGVADCGTAAHFAYRFDTDRLHEIRSNCPRRMGTCPESGLANITLHHNRFSCKVPESISGTNGTEVSGLVLMGNMLGDGNPLSSWVSREENQPFLFYSHSLWRRNMFIFIGFLTLMLSAMPCHRLIQSKLQIVLDARLALDAGIASSSFGLIKCALVAFVAATPLLLIFSFGGKYFLCNPPLWRTTVASHWAEGVWLDLGVVTAWCAMQFLFRSIIASIPKARRAKQRNENNLSSCKSKMVRILVWFLWICIVSILSLPSIFFTCAQSLPSQNAWGLSNQMFQLFYTTAPILAVLIDMALATPLSSNFSRCTGVKADRLLMTFRLFSAWLLAMITTAALDENCLGGWKISWKVCQEGSEEHNRFNWKVYDEEILNTTQDICSFSTTWWHDGRCSRTIVGSVTPFLLGKLLIRSTVQPAALWTFWQFSRLEAAPDRKQGGRHRRLFGVWPKTTGSLIPLQQMAFLTTQMELLIFWSPLVPLLCIGILTVTLTNLLIFDLGVSVYKVELPSDDMNESAAVSKSYLLFALGAGILFQLWHAFCTNMFGRYMLLICSVAVLSPWAERFIPLNMMKRHIWAMEEAQVELMLNQTQAELIEMARMDNRG